MPSSFSLFWDKLWPRNCVREPGALDPPSGRLTGLKGQTQGMRVDCPNCGTQYEVPEIHFSDGARKVRCTECGYRWNQSVTQAHFNEGRKDAPLLDMLEPALDMARVEEGDRADRAAGAKPDASPDAQATASADADADAEAPSVPFAGTEASPAAVAEDIIVTRLDAAAAEAAFDTLEEALAPRPVDRRQQFFEDMAQRWQWGLGVVVAMALLSMLVLGREAVVQALPLTQGLYRGLGLEPWSALRGWDLCVASSGTGVGQAGATIHYDLRNTSAFRRSAPDFFVVVAGEEPVRVDGPARPVSRGQDVRGEIQLMDDQGTAVAGPGLRLGLAGREDHRDIRLYGAC